MAVSNAIGSNVFDILLGLGLPFLLSNFVKGETVPIETGSLIPSIFILFGVLAAVIIVRRRASVRLTPAVGTVGPVFRRSCSPPAQRSSFSR